jgi:hypothetical protein
LCESNVLDENGHARLSPAEIQQQILQDRRLLINGVLIPAVPSIFAERRSYDRFVEYLSDELRIHPRNFAIRGSTLLGFSTGPTADKVWTVCTDQSDHVIDREVRHFETRPTGAEEVGDTPEKRKNRRRDRKFYCYKYFNLPHLPAAVHQSAVFANVLFHLLDRPRTVDAFVYRDWWAVYDRWNEELRSVEEGIRQGRFPPGADTPRSRPL